MKLNTKKIKLNLDSLFLFTAMGIILAILGGPVSLIIFIVTYIGTRTILNFMTLSLEKRFAYLFLAISDALLDSKDFEDISKNITSKFALKNMLLKSVNIFSFPNLFNIEDYDKLHEKIIMNHLIVKKMMDEGILRAEISTAPIKEIDLNNLPKTIN